MFTENRTVESHTSPGRHVVARSLWTLMVAVIVFGVPHVAAAKPGTHGWSVSTWDTTRSTVVFNYEHGVLPEDGSSNIIGYNANFTSTTGRLSAQFGMQYINLTPAGLDWALHGGSGSVVALYGIPIGQRYDNGLPKAAFSLFAGGVPTLLSNGQYNYVSVPFVFGMGMEINPIRHLSIVPWMEGSVSFNFDTVIKYEEFQQRINEISSALSDPEALVDEYVTITYDANGIPIDIAVDDSMLDELLTDVIEYEIAVAMRLRGGLSLVLNLGDRMDLQLNATVAQVGSDFDTPPTWYFGTALAFAWDDPPLGILPEAHRANLLSCDTVATRFKTCSQYHELVEKIRDEESDKLQKNNKRLIVVHEDEKSAKKKPTKAAPPAAEKEEPAPAPAADDTEDAPVTPDATPTAPPTDDSPAEAPAAPEAAPTPDAPPSLSQPIIN